VLEPIIAILRQNVTKSPTDQQNSHLTDNHKIKSH
jgi:hypothetical protein